MGPLILAVILAAQPAPPAPPAAPDASTVTGVTITAPSRAPPATLARRVDEVQAVLATPYDQQTARWSDLYCPKVVGLEPGQEGRIAGRMAAAAREAGLGLGRADCRANVLVIVADDPTAEVEHLLSRNDRFFGEASAAEVRKAFGGDRPVRWLSVSRKLSADGMGLDPPPFKFRVSRITASDRYDLAGVIVLVDAARIDGLSLSALADYLGMVSLAQVKAEPPSPHPSTVLDLFSDPAADRARASGLTAWDRGFLKGLYALDPASNPGMQRFGIARAMVAQPTPPSVGSPAGAVRP